MRFDFIDKGGEDDELKLALENWGRLFLKWKRAGLISGLDSEIIQKHPTIRQKNKNITTIDVTVDRLMKITDKETNFSNQMHSTITVSKK